MNVRKQWADICGLSTLSLSMMTPVQTYALFISVNFKHNTYLERKADRTLLSGS